MRHTVKALRLIIVVLWIAVLLLPVTVALSLWKIFEAGNNVGIGEPSFSMSNGNLSMSVPFYMNNTGFYDISELYLNMHICSEKGEIIKFLTQPINIPAESVVTFNFNATVSLANVLSKDRELLTNSKDLDVSIALHFRVAYVLAFNVARNFTYKWGAPLSNLTVTYVGSNATHIYFLLNFYNNALFPLSGPLKVELYNLQNVSIGSAVQVLDVASNGFYQGLLGIPVSQIAGEGIIRLFFADNQFFERRWGSP
ncbi:MAG: hypothetical protein QW161_06165 [Candidatus Bathyarchaeia archaeon]